MTWSDFQGEFPPVYSAADHNPDTAQQENAYLRMAAAALEAEVAVLRDELARREKNDELRQQRHQLEMELEVQPEQGMQLPDFE